MGSFQILNERTMGKKLPQRPTIYVVWEKNIKVYVKEKVDVMHWMKLT